MGIYIKGMDMPKGCYDCPLLDGEYGDCKVGATGLYDPYRDDCPLTEVQEPHGRLVDVDMAYQETMVYGEHFRKSVLKVIGNLPTIIERSTGENE